MNRGREMSTPFHFFPKSLKGNIYFSKVSEEDSHNWRPRKGRLTNSVLSHKFEKILIWKKELRAFFLDYITNGCYKGSCFNSIPTND